MRSAIVFYPEWEPERQRQQRQQRQNAPRPLGNAWYERASTDANFRVLCAIYWGEGSKANNMFCVANCDSDLIAYIFRWLQGEGLQENVVFNVCYHRENGFSEQEIKSYWQDKLVGLQDSSWRSFVVKDTAAFKVKKVGRQPYGTAYIKIYNTALIQQVMGGIDLLRKGPNE